jgi:hypothetical protein
MAVVTGESSVVKWRETKTMMAMMMMMMICNYKNA